MKSTIRIFRILWLRHHLHLLARAAVLFSFCLSGGTLQAAIAERGTATTTIGANDAATLAINVPTGVVAGDVMMASILEYDNATGQPTCAGWTLIKTNILAGTKTGHGAILYKVSTGSEPASYSFTLTGAPVQSLGSMVAFSGVDTAGGYKPDGATGGPFDVAPVAFLISSTSTATNVGATAITTATANAAIVMFGMGAGPASASTWSGWTTTSPGALTELYDQQAGSGVEKAVTLGAAWATKATAGTTGTGAATLAAGCKNAGILIALKPAIIGTTNALATSGSPSIYGAAVTLTATISPASGSAVPTGSVQFKTNGAACGSPVTVTAGISPNGTASISIASLPVSGSPHTITAEYAATGTLSGSTNSISQTVNKAGTAVALTSSSQTNGYRANVTFAATLPTTASGGVTFKTNGVALCVSNLVGGISHSLSVTNLPRGTNLITAEYAGDSNYLGSTNSMNQMVTNHPPTIAEVYYVRTAGLRLRMFWSELATNWSDADLDGVTNASINLTTTNGVLLTTNSLQLLYPNTAPNVNDRFSYTVTDSYGESSVGYVNVVVNPFVSGQQITTSPGNPYSVTYFGHPGYSYLLQRSTNLFAGSGWVSIRTNTISSTGRTNIVDDFSDLGATPSQAYYRVGWKSAY
ncbi:MAG: Ig-like domain-containing protein [Verrucomicrobiota bacterium]